MCRNNVGKFYFLTSVIAVFLFLSQLFCTFWCNVLYKGLSTKGSLCKALDIIPKLCLCIKIAIFFLRDYFKSSLLKLTDAENDFKSSGFVFVFLALLCY